VWRADRLGRVPMRGGHERRTGQFRAVLLAHGLFALHTTVFVPHRKHSRVQFREAHPTLEGPGELRITFNYDSRDIETELMKRILTAYR
jgi:hypothetical protein